MKVIKYTFMFSFALILLGIISCIIPFWGGNMALIFGVLIVLILSPIYGVLALVKKQQRIEAAMLLISIPLILGVLFKLMAWPFANAMIIMGSQFSFLLSIAIFTHSIIKKNKMPQSILFIVIGYSSIAYCFKSLFWPGSKGLVIVAFITIVVGLFFAFRYKSEFTFSKVVLSTVILLLSLSFITKESTLKERRNWDLMTPSSAHHIDYYYHAWILYSEGDTEKAKTYLQKAINALSNPNNKYSEELPENKETYLKVYGDAIKLLNDKKWDTYENVYLLPQNQENN